MTCSPWCRKPRTKSASWHNPGSAELVFALAGHRELSFPTTALAVIGLRGGWADAAPGGGRLDTLWTPKGGSAAPAG